MKNKGFTLIELLAVIVILAILMVIAVPKILNVIENSRSKAATSSIKLVKKGIKTSVAAAKLIEPNPYTLTEGCYVFDFDTPNANVEALTIDNKDKVGGSIKLCDGKFSDDTLTFDGSTGSSNSSSIAVGTAYTYNEAKPYEVSVPETGNYKLEVWGAQGGDANDASGNTYPAGYGGYSVGTIHLNKNETLYVYVGGHGNTTNSTNASTGSLGGFNGGGNSSNTDAYDVGGYGIYGSGGGATHIATKSGLLSTLSGDRDKILIVAGGGGGASYYLAWSPYYYYGKGGSGGGSKGGASYDIYNGQGYNYISYGGTQENGGINNGSELGTFGQGAGTAQLSSLATGGGGGFFGGTGSRNCTSGSGGSGYIGNSNLSNKKMVMYSTDESYISTNEGDKTEITTDVGAHEPNKANTGDGYAKITFLGN